MEGDRVKLCPHGRSILWCKKCGLEMLDDWLSRMKESTQEFERNLMEIKYKPGDVLYIKAIIEEVEREGVLVVRIPGGRVDQKTVIDSKYVTIKDHERPKRMVKKTISRWLLLGENGQLGSFDSLDLAQDVAKRWGWPVEIIHMKGEHEVEVEEDAT